MIYVHYTKVKDFILSLLFPKRCVGCNKLGSYLCANCFSYIVFQRPYICPVCSRRSIDGLTHPICKTPLSVDGIISAVPYTGVIKSLLHKFKYDPYVSVLSDVIVKLMHEALIQDEIFNSLLKEDPIVAPVPLHRSRERVRGYNHAELIGEKLAKNLSLSFYSDILFRKKATKPQFELGKKERLKNIVGAFAINKKLVDLIKGRTVFVIDDVATTGATLRECAKVLKRNGARKIIGVTFAREV